MATWTVADVMTEGAISVEAGMPFKGIVDVLELHDVNAVPVVDDFDRVLGVVSSADLIPKIEFAGEDKTPSLFEGRQHRLSRTKAAAETARSLMNQPAITANTQMPVAEAARIMDTSNLKRLPVVDDLGRLVGMVTRRDLLKVFLRDDEALYREIVHELLPDIVGAEPGKVHVAVENGIVVLLGEVERRSLVGVVTRMVERIAGVVGVVDRLGYERDDISPRSPEYTPPQMF